MANSPQRSELTDGIVSHSGGKVVVHRIGRCGIRNHNAFQVKGLGNE